MSVTAWWDDYQHILDERADDLVQNTLAENVDKNRRSGILPDWAGYGYFRGRRAAWDLEAQGFKWQRHIRPKKTQSQGPRNPPAEKPEKKKSGFQPYRAGYGHFRGRRSASDLEAQDFKFRRYRHHHHHIPVKTPRENHRNPSAENPDQSRRGGFQPYRAGYGFFRGRRAALDLNAEEHKWRRYHHVRFAKTRNEGVHIPPAEKPEKKRSGFQPYRAGYGYFRGRRAAI